MKTYSSMDLNRALLVLSAIITLINLSSAHLITTFLTSSLVLRRR